ncbi:MAG: signal peptide and transrane prediction [Chthonomonadaceae bacterium]|nr:signal peptide and transrane prediction [Chthonomonadaceae bacterium]
MDSRSPYGQLPELDLELFLKRLVPWFGKLLLWIGIGVLGATLYGILNDQITMTLSPEYFSVFKRAQFMENLYQFGLLEAPVRVQAVLIGTLATWWFGLFLGIALGISSMVGRYSALSTQDYLRAVVGIMVCTFALSLVFGLVAYLVEPAIKPVPANWPFLRDIHAVRGAFAIGAWHVGAYLGGFVGTVLACFWAQRRRSVLARQSCAPATAGKR